MINETDVAYIAGLFDGEGCVQVKQYVEKKKKAQRQRVSNSKSMARKYGNSHD